MDTTPNTAKGRLGILTPGMGAVATTTYAGVLAAVKGVARPVGSVTQLERMELDGETVALKDALPLTPLSDVVFGGWDCYKEDAFEAAVNAGVLSAKDLLAIEPEMRAIKPMKAVIDRTWVKNLVGNGHEKQYSTKWDAAQMVMDDIDRFKDENKLDRVVMEWTGSTEAYRPTTAVHASVAAFEEGLKKNDPMISPSQIYTYAALRKGVPFANGSPNISADTPALQELAMENHLPVAGKDLKTGQTLMKTILAPGFRARLLGLNGWFSTNILGNRDGEILDDPESFKAKEVTKRSVLETILDGREFPELYSNYYHKIRINYYPPRGDDKEAWDNIDIFGWMNYNMQIKINFLCKDSILAAPVVLDVALLLDLANRMGVRGTQEWLSFFFKCPMVVDGEAVNDLFAQRDHMMGQLQIWARKAQRNSQSRAA